MAEKYDLIIVGAGPSGMLAAKAAAQAGLNVALLDRKTDLTHLERMCGQTLVSMNEGLKEKGIILVGGHHTYADATVPFYPYPTFTTGHPDEEDFESLGGFLTYKMGKITEINETVVYDNVNFRIMRGTKRRILWVEVNKESG